MKTFCLTFIWLITLGACLLGNKFQAMSQSLPRIMWWYNTGDFSAGQSSAADLDGDGLLEIAFGCYRNDSSLHVLNAENGGLLWKFNASATGTHGCNDAAPLLTNIDGMAGPEVVLASSCNPRTFAFRGNNGQVLWTNNTRGSDSPPTVADIDQDGKPEILHGEFGGWVRCINAENGTTAWNLAVDLNSWIQTAPTIIDLNRDGKLDFVVASWNFNDLDSVFAYDGLTRQRLWAFPVHDHMYHGSAIADLNGDQYPEIVIGSYNDTVYCLQGQSGQPLWKFKAGGYVGGPVSIGDLNRDGSCDVVFVGGSKLSVLTSSGVLQWEYTIPNYGQCFRGVVLADVNNDLCLDLVFGTSKGILYALNGCNGAMLWNINLALHYGDNRYELDHAPLIADFDTDDTLEVFIVGGYGIYGTNMSGNFGRAYMIKVGKGNGPSWLTFQRDARRQSSLCSYSLTPVEELVEQNNLISKNGPMIFPNPSRGEMHLTWNPASSLFSVSYEWSIRDIQGRILQTGIALRPGDRIETSGMSPGSYFLHTKALPLLDHERIKENSLNQISVLRFVVESTL